MEKGSLVAESSIRSLVKREPWSINLANAIREAYLWKLIKSDNLGKISKEQTMQQIFNFKPVHIEQYYMKTISNNVKAKKKRLKK